jgi:hypothetical protein
MLDEIVDQNKALGLIYQSIVHYGKNHPTPTPEHRARMLDILVGHAVHNMTFESLGREHGISKNRAAQIYKKAIRITRYIIKYHMAV